MDHTIEFGGSSCMKKNNQKNEVIEGGCVSQFYELNGETWFITKTN